MIIEFHKSFKKKYGKLRESEKKKFDERFYLFAENPHNPVLKNHALKGKKKGNFSINITGDLRAIYIEKAKDIVIFTDVDSHSNLYQ